MGLCFAIDVNLGPRMERDLEEITQVFKLDRYVVIDAALRYKDLLDLSDPEDKDMVGEQLTESMVLMNYPQQKLLSRVLGDIAQALNEKLSRIENTRNTSIALRSLPDPTVAIIEVSAA